MVDQTEDVFGNDKSQNQQQKQDTQQQDKRVPDGVSELVGEGKKYATIEDALNSIPHAQEHISNLEKQMKELREDLDSRAKIEDVLAKMQTSQGEGKQAQDLSPEVVEQLINKTLTAREQTTLKANNRKAANDAIIAKYGKDNAGEVVRNKAAELGLSVDSLKALAENSPKAFLAYFETTQNSTPPRTPAGDTTTHNLHVGVKDDTYAYFQKLRRENPTEYHKASTQMRMHQLAKEKGEDFYK